MGVPKNGPSLPQDPVVKHQAFETWTWHQPMGDVEDMEWTACDLSIGGDLSKMMVGRVFHPASFLGIRFFLFKAKLLFFLGGTCFHYGAWPWLRIVLYRFERI